jgi:uncharacterized protein YjbI with pentapeptide repeats
MGVLVCRRRRDTERDIRPIDLTGADLTAADLTAANLARANLTRTNLRARTSPARTSPTFGGRKECQFRKAGWWTTSQVG